MIVSRTPPPPMEVQFIEVTDPDELARIGAQQERFKKNTNYWNAHAANLFDQHRGRYVCVAGEQFFIADTAIAAQTLALAAHPEDDGRFLVHVPREKLVRI
jgi:glutathione S-transferase